MVEIQEMTVKYTRVIRTSTIIYLIAFLFVSCGQPQKDLKSENSFADIDEQLQIYTEGKGENTIVFESGLGVDGSTWLDSGIFDSIGKNNQVIAYNRSGYGKSADSYGARGSQALVNDLSRVINKKSINDKVIIVGHSLGGAIARVYAIQHPEKVKALLFIEPNNENFKQYAEMSQEHENALVSQFKKEKLNGATMEAAQLIENISFLKKLNALPNIPIIVITSMKTDSEMTAENVEDWSLSHQSLGKDISRFTQVKTKKSGHFVYLEEPDLVIYNIRKLLK